VAGTRYFVDLHCHTSASFDSLASPEAVVRAAAARGLTHLAVTDHDTIDGGLAAAEAARAESLPLQVIVGQEIRTPSGDLIGTFLRETVPSHLPMAEAIAAVHAQGGLAGIAHPYDRLRGSLARLGDPDDLEALAGSVDWIEAWNARLMFGDGNARAAELAARVGLPGVAVSDSHTTLEVGVAATIVGRDPGTPEGLREALSGDLDLITGRGSFYARLVTPAAKVVQGLRGRGRVHA
jgi:predicted metal-dependent phosphoesterase TrpH